MKVLVAKERIYLNKDKTQAVKEGDSSAAWLLVAKGGAIDEAVAKHFNIQTEEATATSRVETDLREERRAMVTDGSSKTTEENYNRMFAQREAEITAESAPSNEVDRTLSEFYILEAKFNGVTV